MTILEPIKTFEAVCVRKSNYRENLGRIKYQDILN